MSEKISTPEGMYSAATVGLMIVAQEAGLELGEEEIKAKWDRMIAEVEQRAAEKAWSKLADVAYPLYEAAEAVLLADADKQTLMEPLAKLGARTNPYRRNEGENDGKVLDS